MEQHFVNLCEREIHLRVWNPELQNTVICWHGLARTGGDFIPLAEVLASHGFRVIAPDTLGRGLSQWAVDPAQEYQFPFYFQVLEAMLEHYAIDQFHWIGTSMGGLMGMVLAGGLDKARVRSLVINDIGPEVPLSALRRIAGYVSDPPVFQTLSAFEAYIRDLYAPFGPRDDAGWRAMAQLCARRTDAGGFTSHYDPRIAQPVDEETPAADLWVWFQQIDCPILLIHGQQSDVLTTEIVDEMVATQDTLQLLRFADCGHAPGLHLPEQITPLTEFIVAQP